MIVSVPSYTSFFAGSAGVSGALVGLLFVALSVSPERLKEPRESTEHQAIAATTFTALVDALFLSMAGLLPGNGTQTAALVLGLIGLSSTAGLVIRLWQDGQKDSSATGGRSCCRVSPRAMPRRPERPSSPAQRPNRPHRPRSSCSSCSPWASGGPGHCSACAAAGCSISWSPGPIRP